jgi:amidophosphoribosyltransferase
MPGIIGMSCSENKKDFTTDLFKGVFYQQHWNEEWAGLVVYDPIKRRFLVNNRPGLFRAAFEGRMNDFQGTEAIGYCGIAKEPLEIDAKIGKMCLCFSGSINNCLTLKEQLKNQGISFSERTGNDLEIEVIANLIAQGKDVADGIKRMTEKIYGSYTILILTEEKTFAARSPDGHWCLTLGRKKGEVVIASSSAGFSNLGLTIERELEPGEIISMRDGQWKREGIIPSRKVQSCSFLGVYSDFPSGKFQGIPISLIRKRLGASLAQKDIEKGFIPDIVAPIPDSGRFHAIGYHQEFCRQANTGRIKRVPFYDELLLKWAYAGRSFTPQNKEKREFEADIKILPSSEDYQGMTVVIVDDSIVRGTQARTNLVSKLRLLGIKEIHLRIANPELLSHCRRGKTTKHGECLAVQIPSKEERTKFLGVESLKYNTIDELVRAIGLPQEQLCVDCSLPDPEESQ